MSVQGTIKWYNQAKGYGFVIPDLGGPDIFVHQDVVASARIRARDLYETRPVVVEVEDNKGKQRAKSIALA